VEIITRKGRISQEISVSEVVDFFQQLKP